MCRYLLTPQRPQEGIPAKLPVVQSTKKRARKYLLYKNVRSFQEVLGGFPHFPPLFPTAASLYTKKPANSSNMGGVF